MSKDRIMIGLDFAEGNFPSALCTLFQWAACAKGQKDLDVVFGVSTTAPDPRSMIISMSKYLKPLFCLDERVGGMATEIISGHTRKNNCHPFYSGFNYGSLVNRLLLLANIARCQFLVRVDPGTYPFASPDFNSVVQQHIDFVKGTKKVVSRGYDGRLALRHVFVLDKSAQEKLVCNYTGIDASQQVTGGALWTSSVPGTPAIGFEQYDGFNGKGLTLVWGSDDAIYQILPATGGSKKLLDVSVPRFDPEGMRKTTVEYYRGVVGMVYLSGFMSSGQESSARERTENFLVDLRVKHLDPAKYRPETPGKTMDEEFSMDLVAPDSFLTSIRNGLENHSRLMNNDNWTTIADALKEKLAQEVLV